MFRRIPLLATLLASIFALNGCFVSVPSDSVQYAKSTSVSSVAYYGPHPVYDVYGDSDWCSVQGVHYHSYDPGSDEFFVVDNGRYVFVGDPTYYVSNVSFNTYYYMGVHPLPVGNQWCYINGPHRHHWAASGYYNYTRVGSYNYYTYYGARNSYYNPSHTHYDLHTYYSSHPPVRYSRPGYTSVGMSRPLPGSNRPSYSQPTTSRPSYSQPTTSRPS